MAGPPEERRTTPNPATMLTIIFLSTALMLTTAFLPTGSSRHTTIGKH